MEVVKGGEVIAKGWSNLTFAVAGNEIGEKGVASTLAIESSWFSPF